MFCIFRSFTQLILFVCLSFVIVVQVRADDLRTWTDSTGKFKVRAKFDSLEGGNAKLIRENGDTFTIALEKLSKADQEYIAKQNSENPFQAIQANPFESAGPASETTSETPRVAVVDWSKALLIPLQTSDPQWQVTLPDVPAANYSPKSTPLPPVTDFFEKANGLAISQAAKAAVVGFGLKKPSDRDGTERIILCDLKSGRVTASGATQGEMAPLALHDDGRQILMRRNEFGFGNQDRLEIWSLKGKNVVRSLIWTPYEDDRDVDKDVIWAEFIDAKTLATTSSGGKATLWNYPAMQPICYFQLSEDSIPALSPDRKWIAFASDDTVGLFDIEKREVIAAQKTPRKLQWPALAFSPSGRKIGCIAFDRILVWDTASGQLEKDFALPGLMIHGGISFPDESYILANKQFLIELENQLKLWHYMGAKQVKTAAETTFFVAPGDNKSGMLIAAKVPHPEALALLKKALQQPDLFVFHKGTPVKLDVSGIPEDHKKDVTDALTKKLQDMKCPIGDNGNVDVVAGIEGPKSKEVSYMHSGTYQVQEYLTKLKFVYQGKIIWETNSTNITPVIILKKGENVEGVLRKASEQPTYTFYDKVALPEFLQKPAENQNPKAVQTIGMSNVTPQGFR
ncbi:MAG: SHD1 domain-containing protein [Thermoguttaceae bacterium]|jgi:WD40 repeat protein